MTRAHLSTDDLISDVDEREVRAVEIMDRVKGARVVGPCLASLDLVQEVPAREVRTISLGEN